jgi:enoyl-CoA hydratase
VTSLVTYEMADGVAVLTLDDGKANVLSLEMLAAINDALDQAAADDAVVVLTGRPGIFSGGFDLKVLRAGGEDAARMLEEGFELSLRLLEFPSPVIIACSGHAVAMGLFILLSADYRIGVDGTFKIVANEAAIGMTMPWAAIEITRYRVAPAHLHRVLALAETYTPAEAVAAGILDRVVAEPDLRRSALELAALYAGLDRTAHEATKLRVREEAVGAIQEGLEADQAIFRQMSGLEALEATEGES